MVVVFAVGLSLALASPLAAQQRSEISAEYDFFVGGFRVADVALAATEDETGYSARSSVATRGMLEILLRGRAASQVRGIYGAFGQFVPKGFATRYSSRKGEQTIRIAYEEKGPARVEFDPKATDTERHAAPRERLGTLDPVSAAVMALMPSAGTELCNRTIPVFDGKRRFDILFLPPDPARFDESAPAPDWPKPLIRCLGVYERISGFAEGVSGNARYFPFDVWFERTSETVHRAVRVAGNTKLGFAIGNLRDGE